MTGNRTTELKPCPFCGGEAKTRLNDRWWVHCSNCTCEIGFEGMDENGYYGHFDTEAEAIATWNTRAPIEYDGWFYLPKPKERIVVYGEPEIARTENGYKVRQFADVVDEAARKWGEELGEYIMQRICETWNTRAEPGSEVDE